jgi:predicted RNase H-like HicB family nuclease
MPGHFTLVLLQCESWWIGWVSELPAVNAHADTRDGLLDTLRTALGDALEMNPAEAFGAPAEAPYMQSSLVSVV